MKRKTTSLFVILCMVLALLPVSTFPVYAVGGLTVTGGVPDTDYTYAGDVLTITSGTAISISAATTTADRIVVQSGIIANITLNGVNIDVSALSGASAIALDMSGATVNLTLTGDNTLKSGSHYPGLEVPSGASLTIGGTGSLRATAGAFGGAGIGSEDDEDAGTITITSGTVYATGSQRSAGIGGGEMGAGGTIIISGGTVDARGSNAPGIGGGEKGAGGTISINGGNVTATGGSSAAGIGTGYQGTGGAITISGGTVTATGGYAGAGIGGGNQGNSGTINISGATIVTATGGSAAPGIGTGLHGDSWLITIASPANIKASGQGTASAIERVSACNAYILMANFTSDKGAGIKTEIRTSAGAILAPAIEWAPAVGYRSMAFTLSGDSAAYTLYTDGVKQQYTNDAITSDEFAITGAGLSAFDAVTEVPTYTMSASTLTAFASQTVGYGTAPAEQTVTITNTGNQLITLTQPISTNYTIGALSTTTLAVSGTATFTVQPKTGLAVGNHDETINITGSNSAMTSVSAQFDVTAVPARSSSGGSIPATTVINTNTGSVTGNQLNNAAKAAKDGEAVTIQSGKTNEVTIPTSGFDALTGNNNSLTVATDKGTLTFDSNAVTAMGAQATAADIIVLVEDVEKDTLTEEEQTKVGDKTVYDLSVMSGGKLISSFNGGTVTVSIPYELKTGEKAENLTVWYLADDGTLTEISCAYDEKAKAVTFVVNHFSKYVVGYDSLANWINPFADIMSSDWFYDAVGYVNLNGLMNGQTGVEFGPETAMTRGMFVTILGRMENIDTAIYANQTTFSDVNNNQYYAPYTAWACDKEIVTGVGSGKFAPDAAITREQMAVMLTNYMKLKDRGPVGAWAIQLTYSDLDQISSWAGEGVMFTTMKELMKGTGNDANGTPLFSPLSTSTRAQTAQVMMNLEEVLK
ncbi:MAG: S-layer homology domain-containing protein [Anaerovoracaceae bacterium]